MSIKIFPLTGSDHVGFVDDGGRRYIIDFRNGPRLKLFGEGAHPDPFIVSQDAFDGGSDVLRATGLEEEDVRYTVFVDQRPSDLSLTKVEVATLASVMPSGQ